ncbi:hypothetical protein ACVOMV_12915 [Mesorhizobium atlanticum]
MVCGRRCFLRDSREQLAICRQHPERILFLDIETTGLPGRHYDEITIVGWSIAGRASTMVKGESHEQLRHDAQGALALVTFNGIPFRSEDSCGRSSEMCCSRATILT